MEQKSESATEQEIIYCTRLHWVIFFGPVLGLLIALSLYYFIIPLRPLGLFLAGFALIWVGFTWVTYYFSSVTIKKKQVILRTGIIVRQTVDIPLTKIETIDIRQSILGSILGYGMLLITGTGGTRHMINFLQNPLTCRRYIEQLMNDH